MWPLSYKHLPDLKNYRHRGWRSLAIWSFTDCNPLHFAFSNPWLCCAFAIWPLIICRCPAKTFWAAGTLSALFVRKSTLRLLKINRISFFGAVRRAKWCEWGVWVGFATCARRQIPQKCRENMYTKTWHVYRVRWAATKAYIPAKGEQTTGVLFIF